MSYDNPSLIVSGQVPEFIAADSPLFVEFLQAYYKFADEYNIRIEILRDADRASSLLLSFLKSELLNKYPAALINDRKLIGVIRTLYRLKGTLSSIEVLFRLFFNDAVTIYQPSQQILRASDGRWLQEHYITVEQQYGDIDFSQPIQLKISNDDGIFFVNIDRYEIVSRSPSYNIRFFYKSIRSIPYAASQTIDIVDDAGNITFRGKLVKSPSRLRVTSPGHDWKLGQAIIVEGSTSPTVARVTQIGPNGELQATEIIEYGYSHTENQTILISPYPNKPATSGWELETVVNGISNGIPHYLHTLTLNSYISSIKESIFGLSNADSPNSYFLENYTSEIYNAQAVLQQEYQSTGTSFGLIVTNTDLTIEQWLSSRATIVYDFEYEIKTRGTWQADNGLISTPTIKLQDNYFYQMFSYVIQTSKQTSEYSGILSLIHPAGLKYFGELTKVANLINQDISITRDMSRNRIYFNDAVTMISTRPSFWVLKKLNDQLALTDTRKAVFTKRPTSNLINLTDSITSKQVIKVASDAIALTDGRSFTTIKKLTDTPVAADSIANKRVTKIFTETATTTETVPKILSKPKSDTVTVNDGSATINISTTTYAAADYFAEQFAADEKSLTIG